MLFIHPDCFCVSLRVLGDISCRNSSVSFQKPWPGYSTSSSDLIDGSFHVGTKLFVLLPLSCLSPADVVKGFMCVHVVINTQTISCVVVFGVIKQSGMKTHSVYRQLCLWQLFRCSQAVWWCFVCYGDDFYILQIPQLHNLGKQSRTMRVSGLMFYVYVLISEGCYSELKLRTHSVRLSNTRCFALMFSAWIHFLKILNW